MICSTARWAGVRWSVVRGPRDDPESGVLSSDGIRVEPPIALYLAGTLPPPAQHCEPRGIAGIRIAGFIKCGVLGWCEKGLWTVTPFTPLRAVVKRGHEESASQVAKNQHHRRRSEEH